MKPILEVKNVWKSYKIGARQERYLSLRDSMVGFLKNGWQKKETFWALKDVSFDVYPGETLGIIGRNGAGKTTLLKILSRITPPTKGSIKVRGRLASLLEVGTGFHPELTGRENIYLNGSILGLKRREINRQFDAIVDFSGVEDFLDTPLKHYSSGMQLRLAFAVAAHLEPEILLIDEVLAVGDAEFQRRCIGKMDEVSKSGRTVLFVSHNQGAVKQLCTKGMVIDKGQCVFWGTSLDALGYYSEKISKSDDAVWVNSIDKNPEVLLERIEIRNARGKNTTKFLNSENIELVFQIKSFSELKKFTIGFDLLRGGTTILRSRQIDAIEKDELVSGERNQFTCTIPKWFLHEGSYVIKPFMALHFEKGLSNVYEEVELKIDVIHDPSRSVLHQVLNGNNQPGLIFPTLNWSCESYESV